MEMSESLTMKLSEVNYSKNEIEKGKQTEKAIKIPIKIDNNQIIIKVKIGFSDILKSIYFLDNYIDKSNENSHKYLKELNKSNTKLYINEEEFEYEKYFVPWEDGIYTIRLSINILMKDCSHMFYNCNSITSIDLSSFNFNEVINMYNMFTGCNNLKKIQQKKLYI